MWRIAINKYVGVLSLPWTKEANIIPTDVGQMLVNYITTKHNEEQRMFVCVRVRVCEKGIALRACPQISVSFL